MQYDASLSGKDVIHPTGLRHTSLSHSLKMILNNAGNNTLNDNAASKDPQLIAAESKFRAHVKAMRIRLVDLFADFDKLRSGYISAAQFRRSIGAAYDKGVVRPLTTEESELIVQNYLVKKNGMIKWRAFVDSIEKGWSSATTEGILKC